MPAAAHRSFPTRLASAVRRRAVFAWSRLAVGDRPPAVEAAWEWLSDRGSGGGVRSDRPPHAPCPALTAACLETARDYGCRDLVHRWARWLMSVQSADGSVPDSRGPRGLLEYTASALRGLLAAEDVPGAERAARRAGEFVFREFERRGSFEPVETRDMAESRDGGIAGELRAVAALKLAGRRWSRSEWITAFDRTIAAWARDVAHFPGLLSAAEIAAGAMCWVELDRVDVAGRLMQGLETVQRRDGSFRRNVEGGPVTSAGVAQAAVVWYRLGRRERADRALRYVEARQLPNGAFPSGWGWTASRRLRAEDAWTVKHYLDAAALQVRAAFEANWQGFPDRIDPKDGRAKAVRRWCAAMAPDGRIAELGCGKGRFLRHMMERFPTVRLTGVDISPAMLARLPEGVHALEGSLLRVPAADGAFDGAFAVESLEHSLLPERAVAELCRVVRPGGRLLVIDKHRARQPLSEHDPWERWFLPEELGRWLGRFCRDVRVGPISHVEGRPGIGLFLAATGIRNGR